MMIFKRFFEGFFKENKQGVGEKDFLREFHKNGPCFCIVCSERLQMFYPFNHRHFVRCPFCDSFERHRLLWHFITTNKSKPFDKHCKIFHVAPEIPLFKKFSNLEHVDYIPADLYPEKYPEGTVKVDVNNISYEAESFDIVIANHILEHIPDDRRAMAELCRILKSDGWAILNVPIKMDMEKTDEDLTITDPRLLMEKYGQSDHVRWYGRDYIDRLEESGFDVEVIDYFKTMSNMNTFKFGFLKGEPLFYCKKKSQS